MSHFYSSQSFCLLPNTLKYISRNWIPIPIVKYLGTRQVTSEFSRYPSPLLFCRSDKMLQIHTLRHFLFIQVGDKDRLCFRISLKYHLPPNDPVVVSKRSAPLRLIYRPLLSDLAPPSPPPQPRPHLDSTYTSSLGTWQVRPSVASRYPGWQEQLAPCSVLVHMWSQPPLPWRHLSTSTVNTPATNETQR